MGYKRVEDPSILCYRGERKLGYTDIPQGLGRTDDDRTTVHL